MQKAGCILFAVLFCMFATKVSCAQEAIEISKLLSGDDDISVRDISKINGKIIISDTLRGWDFTWFGGFNGSQAAYRNWSQGGANTISVTASSVFDLKYRKNYFAYAFTTDLKYGKARIQDEGTRKTNDRIALNNKFSYLFDNTDWSAFANVNLATQFDKGYEYDVPEGEDPIVISKFFAPAYFTQVVGIGYKPTDYFIAEAGLALKQTIVADTALSLRYGLDPGETFRFEPGYSVALNFEKNIVSNVKLISSVETFTNLQRNITSTDIHFSNELIGKINDYLNTTFQFMLIYDDDFSKEVQLKQVLAAGLSFNIF